MNEPSPPTPTVETREDRADVPSRNDDVNFVFYISLWLHSNAIWANPQTQEGALNSLACTPQVYLKYTIV